jgi:hypothetical protein
MMYVYQDVQWVATQIQNVIHIFISCRKWVPVYCARAALSLS